MADMEEARDGDAEELGIEEPAEVEAAREERTVGGTAATVATEAEAEGALPAADEFQLSRAFYEAYKAYRDLIQAPSGEEAPKTEEVQALSVKLKAIAWHVHRLRLFSPNEELDDINTADLKFMLTPFLLAEASAAERDYSCRLPKLKAALVFWKAFAHDCERLRIAHSEDHRALEDGGSRDAASRRTEKVERYKRVKELDAKVSFLFERKRVAKGDELSWGAYGEFDDDLERDLVLALLSRAMASVAESVTSARAELPMLEEMARRGGPSKERKSREKTAPAEPPWFVRIQDKSELHKLYLEQVFQPTVPLPTITVEEFGDMEMADARARQERTQANEFRQRADEEQRWCGRTSAEGSKAEWEEEAKTYKDREWDDWKDEHPWGSGNKMANNG